MARGGYHVRVVAETCADRMVVEALGRSGASVWFTVKRENLAPLQPGLFDSAGVGRKTQFQCRLTCVSKLSSEAAAKAISRRRNPTPGPLSFMGR